jgi:hypothetical protein
MLKKKLFLVLAVLLPSYSYSDSIAPYYGSTGNAAAGGSTWSMGTVLPTPPGLDINGIIYNYTIQKQIQDSVNVHIQNKNALGTGYIFRETDEWKPGSLGGTEINKAVPVIPGIPREAWGQGSIVTEGNGSVSNPSVIYTYKVDPCYDPQYSPNCPGYKAPSPVIYEVDLTTIYDVTLDKNVTQYGTIDTDLIAMEDKKENLKEEDEEEKEKKDSKERLEKALSAASTSEMYAQALAQSQVLDSINMATNMNSYYNATILGGTYKESIQLADKKLPENKKGLRNGLAQQILHNKMVDMQY